LPAETVLYSFKGGKAGGAPFSGLITDANGALYGTASGAGSGTCGTAFQLSPPAGSGQPWTQKILHVFTHKADDGCAPFGGLVAGTNGVLYGATADGGAEDGGAVFSLTPPGAGGKAWAEAVIYSFAGPSEPAASLVLDPSGVLYGTTSLGGANGSVFALAPPAGGATKWTETTLYAFQGGKDGRDPIGGLTEDSAGNLYGTTFYGGIGSLCASGQGCGTVFMLTPPAAGQTAWTETLLYAFSGGAEGAYPYGGLLLGKAGLLFGTTVGGGDARGDGVVFSLTPRHGGGVPWLETVLYSFAGSDGDGAHPYGTLASNLGGTLFGTTVSGGSSCCGTVFELAPPGAGGGDWTEIVLTSFQGGADGAYPYGGLLWDTAKNLYGTTFQGGASGDGTVFLIPP
jgi:uncharacterized repeat protein (TIGR03803 family)